MWCRAVSWKAGAHVRTATNYTVLKPRTPRCRYRWGYTWVCWRFVMAVMDNIRETKLNVVQHWNIYEVSVPEEAVSILSVRVFVVGKTGIMTRLRPGRSGVRFPAVARVYVYFSKMSTAFLPRPTPSLPSVLFGGYRVSFFFGGGGD